MLLIPAIDLKEGKCVRLRQGRMEDETIFSDDPLATAARWVEAGAKRLHIVDLDGAFAGRPKNAHIVRAIAETWPELPIQIGGGIRDRETVQQYLDAGVRYVIIGTRAVTAPHFVSELCSGFPGHIIVGLDARDGKLALDGWSKTSGHDAIGMAKRFEQEGVAAIVYTDISRDGMMTGINVNAVVAMARAITIPVIAAGGLHTLDDVRALCRVAGKGIIGAITGRAIYEGTLDFAEGQRLAETMMSPAQEI
uniref:1-(5-phosphoribosyl)-5-[(5-phosphoribosylamino)methylideneamino] imidazole-4-carboxamide isomerase n=1 Tax=Candidatus Kentrum sp. FM TaxID=2126340 RepID=A0A450TEU9_9GAMM|nr:MAG: phosphoribosylformimino-5-aminoimidazole carboxamide ribotide isomerase [Candidatus Kentron sp. FM]VFJ70337.1 MAG: phosphoribosylformimino-5-aminoimidazole carboxamide ribotide isomerase [Candidatus Kentron sp. FM]VFK23443.1 MAG: phosphoribosylformimino-5-aminoimidazole carboxamide ribotide isomerase [Candidatus Kentron sp. FM]